MTSSTGARFFLCLNNLTNKSLQRRNSSKTRQNTTITTFRGSHRYRPKLHKPIFNQTNSRTPRIARALTCVQFIFTMTGVLKNGPYFSISTGVPKLYKGMQMFLFQELSKF